MEQPDCRRIGKEPVSLQYFFYKIPVDWNGRYETPAGKAWPGRPPQASAEGGPPAESECLEWKSLHIPPRQKRLWVSASQSFGRSVANLQSNEAYSKKHQ
ncbi:hypothetical protein AM232_02680 [Bacillus sp. FJAT-21352]|nr:hypothetical protein AM232_02680 [Bacillus sp. FJAT-21352]